jgi:MHS family alpha-ketoglutarate permease-like MFS transporter
MADLSEAARTAPAHEAELRPLQRVKAILGGSAGNLVEWYDWFAYSSFALYFAPHFFPQGDQTAQLLQAAAVFAIGFLARPVGAWLMGLYADRRGRRAALTVSVALMSAGSLAIALIPDYAVIGVGAPALLLLARLVQGLSLGGEYGASAVYLTEMAGHRRRGFWSSFQFLTLIAGQLTALGVLIVLQHLLPEEALQRWGWRIPFLIGGVLAIVVFWIRTGLTETRAFERAEGAPRASTGMLLRDHPRQTLAIIGLTCAGSLSFYAYTTYMQKFLVNTSGFPKDVATAVTAGVLVVYMLVQPLVGLLGDLVGRVRMMGVGFAMGVLITYPAFQLLAGTSSPIVAFAVMTGLVLILSPYSAVNAAVKSELFPTHVRALGVALPYAIANAVFGGTAEYVALWFKGAGHESGFFIYVAALQAVAMVICWLLPNTNSVDLEAPSERG